MNRSIFLASAAAAALSLAACDSNSDNMASADNALALNDVLADADNSAMAADPAMPTAAQAFVDMAGGSDMYEIESSKLALDKSQNADIRAYAQMLVTEHQKSTADIKAAAAKASPAITPAPMMTAEQTANIAALRAASAADFDALYLQQQIPAHETALALHRNYADNGDTPALRETARAITGPVEKHLTQARDLSR